MQTGGTTGVIATAADVVRGEPWTTFWRGAVPALTSALVENAVLFTVNGALQRSLAPGGDTARLSPLQQALIGGASAVASSTAITPSEVVKVRLQAAQAAHAAGGGGGGATVIAGTTGVGSAVGGPWHMARRIMAADGVVGFYRGLPAAMSRDVPFYVVYFGAYHAYTSRAMGWTGVRRRAELPVLHNFIGGGLAGSMAWGVMFPMDAVKSRWQAGMLPASIRNPLSAAAHIAATGGGWRALYRGWSAAVMRGFPANGALFVGIEMAQRALSNLFPILHTELVAA